MELGVSVSGGGGPLSEELLIQTMRKLSWAERGKIDETREQILRAFAREIQPHAASKVLMCTIRHLREQYADLEKERDEWIERYEALLGERIDHGWARAWQHVKDADAALLASQESERALRQKLTSLESVDKQLTDARERAMAVLDNPPGIGFGEMARRNTEAWKILFDSRAYRDSGRGNP